MKRVKKMNGRVIFVAMPTKGSTLRESAQTGRMRVEVYQDLAKLHKSYPNRVPVSFVDPAGL